MIISKILNNSVVLTFDEHNQEVVVMGKGIAFQKKVGDILDDSLIDKIFLLSRPDILKKFQELVNEIPIDYFEISNEIVENAKLSLGKRLNDSIYLSLSDHIYSSILRLKQGITIKNALLWDIKRFYPDEFKIGQHAVKRIKEHFDIELPNDEAGFIAIHIVNAEDKEDNQDAYQVTKIIQDISAIVRYYFQTEFDEESVNFYRFINHLKFFAQRLLVGKMHQDESDEELLNLIKLKYKNAYKCVEKIAIHIQKNYQYPLTFDEKLYLTVHIQRVIYQK